MNSLLRLIVPAAAFTTLAISACGNVLPARGERAAASQEQVMVRPKPPAPDAAAQHTESEGAQSDRPQSEGADSACGEPVSNLPFSRGRAFATLDEYLAYLELQGAIDLPWWRQIGRGVYERVVRMPEAQRETATREELMSRFGFRC